MKTNFFLLIIIVMLGILTAGNVSAATVELLTGATQSSWTTSYAPYRTYYHDSRAQSIYLKTDLEASGISGSAVIEEICFYCSETPGRNIENLRIRMQNTSLTSLSSFTTTGWTTVYGPESYAAPTAGAWKCHTLSPAFVWDGVSNLMVDVYRNDSAWTNGGGNYIRSTGAGRTYAGYCDSCSGCGPGGDCDSPSARSAFSHVLNAKLTYYHNQAPNIPTLNSPTDGATGISITPNLMFDYSDLDSNDCTKFDIIVDDNSDFSSPEINETDYSVGGPWASGLAVTYSVPFDLFYSTQYYWKARVYDGADWSDWSNGTWDFTTEAAPVWDSSNWDHRREITISPTTTLPGYRVKVELTTADMGNPYTNVNADGSDIRFTAADGTTLQNYWIGPWDNTGTSTIWVEIQYSGVDTIYMYYGNATATQPDDNVFYDDCQDAYDKGKTTNGYRYISMGSLSPVKMYCDVSALDRVYLDLVVTGGEKNYVYNPYNTANQHVTRSWTKIAINVSDYSVFLTDIVYTNATTVGASWGGYTYGAANGCNCGSCSNGMSQVDLTDTGMKMDWNLSTTTLSGWLPGGSILEEDGYSFKLSGGGYCGTHQVSPMYFLPSEVRADPDPTASNIGSEESTIVFTNVADNITSDSAQLNGDLTDLGGAASVDVWFEWGTSTAYGSITVSTTKFAPGSFSAVISDLSSSATYHFRAVARNTAGTNYGDDKNFSTLAVGNFSPASASVSDVPDTVDIGNNVTFTGNWSESNTGDNVKMYICKDSTCSNCNNTSQTNCWCHSSAWNTEPDTTDTCDYTAQAGDTGDNNYWLGVCDDDNDCDVTPLAGGTFTVNGPVFPPVVSTNVADNITSNSAQLNSSLTDLGGAASVNVWFEWGTSTAYGSITASTTKFVPGNCSTMLSDLSLNTTYHFRAVAQNTATTSYGDDKSFVVLATAADWYDPNWNYRWQITISPIIPIADYQVKVELTTADMGSPYADINADGSDLRFTGSDGTTLQDYWIESWNNTGTSTIWVEVKDPETNTIYMYYDNPVAVCESSGADTFDFFDNFEDGDFTSNPAWNKIPGANSADASIVSMDGSYWMKMFRVVTACPFYTAVCPFDFSSGFAIEYKVKLSGGDYTGSGFALATDNDDAIYNVGLEDGAFDWESGFLNWDALGNIVTFSLYNQTGDNFTIPHINDNTVYNVKLTRTASDEWKLYLDDIEKGNITTNSVGDASISKIQLMGKSSSAAGNGAYFDDFKVRKYVDPEPVTSFHTKQNEFVWNYRKAVSIDNTQNSNTLTDYQVKIEVASSAGGDVSCDGHCQDNFADIRFTTDDGETPIDHWRASYAASSIATFWLKIPVLPASSTTTIYMYYGNPIAGSASNFDNTFTKDYVNGLDNNLVALYHADTGSGTILIDSSGHGRNGTFKGSGEPAWSGSDGGQWNSRSDIKFSTGDSLEFDGADDKVFTPLSILGQTAGTMEAWFYIDSLPTGSSDALMGGTIIDTSLSGHASSFQIRHNSGDTFLSLSEQVNGIIFGDTPLSTSTWYHGVATWGPGGRKIYLNGVEDFSGGSTAAWDNLGNNVQIGARQYTTGSFDQFFNGTIDEVRVYNRILNADEIKCLYERREYINPELSVHYVDVEPGIFTVKKADACDCTLPIECYSEICEAGVCGTTSISIYITDPIATSPTSTSAYCHNEGGGEVDFSWVYQNDNGHNMREFRFQAATSNFPAADLVVNTTTTLNVSPGATVVYNRDVATTTQENKLVYGQTYYWQVEVCDVNDNCSGWIEIGEPAQTASHLYPSAGFVWTPQEPTKNEIVQFCSLDEGNCTSTLSGDATVCYNDANIVVPCYPEATFQWSIDLSGEFVDGTSATSANPRIRFSTTTNITLDIIDGAGFGCCSTSTSLGIKPPIPEYKEVSPLSFIKNTLASMVSVIRSLAFFFL